MFSVSLNKGNLHFASTSFSSSSSSISSNPSSVETQASSTNRNSLKGLYEYFQVTLHAKMTMPDSQQQH